MAMTDWFAALPVAAVLYLILLELKALHWMAKDTVEDIRWYRSQNRCRYCIARLDPEWAEFELKYVLRRKEDGE